MLRYHFYCPSPVTDSNAWCQLLPRSVNEGSFGGTTGLPSSSPTCFIRKHSCWWLGSIPVIVAPISSLWCSFSAKSVCGNLYNFIYEHIILFQFSAWSLFHYGHMTLLHICVQNVSFKSFFILPSSLLLHRTCAIFLMMLGVVVVGRGASINICNGSSCKSEQTWLSPPKTDWWSSERWTQVSRLAAFCQTLCPPLSLWIQSLSCWAGVMIMDGPLWYRKLVLTTSQLLDSLP